MRSSRVSALRPAVWSPQGGGKDIFVYISGIERASLSGSNEGHED
jgi:hypothetical protein